MAKAGAMTTPSFDIPKLQTESLHDPVAEFVPAQDPDGDSVPELPGGLNREVMPSPRGGFMVNKSQSSELLGAHLQRRPDRQELLSKNILKDTDAEKKNEQVQKVLNQFLSERPNRDDLLGGNQGAFGNRDAMDGLTPRSEASPRTPRRDRAYDALMSPRASKPKQ